MTRTLAIGLAITFCLLGAWACEGMFADRFAYRYIDGEGVEVFDATIPAVADAAAESLVSLGYLNVTREELDGVTGLAARHEDETRLSIRIAARDDDLTEMRVRVGVFGDEKQTGAIFAQTRRRLGVNEQEGP
ncbi:MAG: DUF3568 family protein [Phycisphaeraceae bacterium]|nr:DUF3568 family protein [Phycisphaeraceae bacterium]